MDEILTNKLDEIAGLWDTNHEDCQNNHTPETFLSLKLTEAGYRLDPYPNGKSKGELIARIETVEAERDKTRNLLRDEHAKLIMEIYESGMDRHRERYPDCPVCTFLAETSSVKP